MSWPTKKLGDICHIYGGDAAPQDKTLFKGGSVPFIRMQDLGRYHITTELRETADKLTTGAIQKLGLRIWRPGVILIPRSGSVYMNHRAILGTNAVVVSHIAILFDFSEEILPHYLFYYLTTVDMGRYGTKTTGIDSISFSQLGRIKISFPSLKIQKQIVEHLDKIAEAQKLNDELIQKADELFQSLLHKELNPVGKKWGTEKLGEYLIRFDRGISWSHKNEGGTIAVLRIPNIKEGEIDINDLKYINTENENGKLEKDDIVMVASNGNPDLVGRSALVTEKENGMRFASFLIRLRLDDMKLLPQYAHSFLLTPFFKQELRQKIATTSGIYNLKKEHIEKIKIPIPPPKTQKQIVAKLSAAQEYKKQLLEQRIKLKELFDSVLHKSMRNE